MPKRYTASGRERRALRAAMHGAPAAFQIGRGGVDETWLEAVDAALAAREVVRVRVNRGVDAVPGELAAGVADRLDAEVVEQVGRAFLLYRPRADRESATE